MFGLNPRQLFFILLLVAAGFAAAQYVPGYFNAFQLNDFIRQEVRYAASARKTPEIIAKGIVDRARELSILVNPRDVRITRRGPSFTIDLDYKWPIDLRVYQHELIFHSTESGEVFENRRR